MIITTDNIFFFDTDLKQQLNSKSCYVVVVVVVVVVYVDNAKTLIIMHMKACKKIRDNTTCVFIVLSIFCYDGHYHLPTHHHHHHLQTFPTNKKNINTQQQFYPQSSVSFPFFISSLIIIGKLFHFII